MTGVVKKEFTKMEESKIIFNGIETNNLKKIDFSFPISKITSITGVSGGGKSSLAYGTVYEVCNQEFKSIENGSYYNDNYVLASYENIIPSIAIRQKNSNVNPKSTIYSHLNFSSILSSYSGGEGFNLPIDKLKLNKPNLQCKDCNGSGLQYIEDDSLIIDYEKSIKSNPFKPWDDKRNTLHFELLLEFCRKEGIPLDIPFKELIESHKNLLLYSKGSERISFKYKHSAKRRVGKKIYVGIMEYLGECIKSSSKSEFDFSIKYTREFKCTSCSGSGVDKKQYLNLNIEGINFIDFLIYPISDLLFKFKFIESKMHKLIRVLSEINEVGLGYLCLARSIPTLSGGELQKLSLAKASCSNISGILYVIDEISSQVHCSDYKKILNKIFEIRDRNNTVLLVEHNDFFIENSDYSISIGPVAGELGGYVVDCNEKQSTPINFSKEELEFFKIGNINKNNVKGVDLNIPINSVLSIVGKSGAGKSSIASFINDEVEGTVYISQNDIKGNIKSSVSTITGANKKVAKLFSNKYGEQESFFIPNENSPISCKRCIGKGVVRYSRAFEDDVEIICPECSGSLFSELANDYVLDGLTVKDFYNYPISFLYDNGFLKGETLFNKIIEVGLGHLSLSRKTQTLSGGEIKRIKLVTNVPSRRTKDKILIIDEPASGLDDKTAKGVMDFILKLKINFKAIIIIDHKPSAFLRSDYLYEVGPFSGENGGRIVFSGFPCDYYKEVYLGYFD